MKQGSTRSETFLTHQTRKEKTRKEVNLIKNSDVNPKFSNAGPD